MAPEDALHNKRPLNPAEVDYPSKKRVLRHHKPTWNPDHSRRHDAPRQNEESVQFLLVRSISLALAAVGFEAAEPLAVESLRAEVEECMI